MSFGHFSIKSESEMEKNKAPNQMIRWARLPVQAGSEQRNGSAVKPLLYRNTEAASAEHAGGVSLSCTC